jgi:hypothetical protein
MEKAKRKIEAEKYENLMRKYRSGYHKLGPTYRGENSTKN